MLDFSRAALQQFAVNPAPARFAVVRRSCTIVLPNGIQVAFGAQVRKANLEEVCIGDTNPRRSTQCLESISLFILFEFVVGTDVRHVEGFQIIMSARLRGYWGILYPYQPRRLPPL